MTPEDSPPVPFPSQCRILVPTTSRYIFPAITFTVLQQNPLLTSLRKKEKTQLLLSLLNNKIKTVEKEMK